MDKFNKKLFITLFEYGFAKIFYNIKNESCSPILFRYKELDGLFFTRKLDISNELEGRELKVIKLIVSFLSNGEKDTILLKNEISLINLELIKIIFDIDGIYNNGNHYDFFCLLLKYYKIDNNYNSIEELFILLLDNINLIDKEFLFYIYWYSLKLFSKKLIKLDELYIFFKINLTLDKNNPYFLLDYSRLLGIHLFSFYKNIKYVDLSILYIKKSFNILNKKDIRGYMYSWLGAAFRHKKEYQKSLYFIEKGILLNKKESKIYNLPYYWKLSLLGEMGDYYKQIKFAYKLINNNFDSFRIYKNLSRAYLNIGNQNKSEIFLLKSLNIIMKEKPLELIDNGKHIFIGNKKYNYIESNVILLNDINLINFISIMYKKMIHYGGIHFIGTQYLEKLCYQYLEKFR